MKSFVTPDDAVTLKYSLLMIIR